MIDEEKIETDANVSDNSATETSQDAPIVPNPVIPESVKPSPQQENFRILRERAERAEREKEEYARKVAEYETKIKPSIPEAEEDLDFNIGADEIAEGKHLTKVGRKIKQLEEKIKQAEKARMDLQQQTETNSVIAGIKAEFPDIDKVVNADTMEMLRQKAPHLEKTIRSSTDLYSKAAAAYQAIKDMGIYVDDSTTMEKDRVQKNMTKPRTTAQIAGTSSPLSQADIFANGLTPELKDRLHKEMLEAIKSR
jgi:hypothetical protein